MTAGFEHHASFLLPVAPERAGPGHARDRDRAGGDPDYATSRVDVQRGEYSYGWKYEVEGKPVLGGPTRILELIENQKLVHDWTDWRNDPAKPLTRVTWLLKPLAGGTRTSLTLVHDGFAHPVDRSDYQQGWEGFLTALPAALGPTRTGVAVP